MNILRPYDIKQKYKLSTTTLLMWEKDGRIKPIKTTGGHRRYDEEQILTLLKANPLYDGLGYHLELQYSNFAPMPKQIDIVGRTSFKRSGEGRYWSVDTELAVPDTEDVYTIGHYRKISSKYTNDKTILTCHPRIATLATSCVHRSVILENRENTGNLLRCDKYCKILNIREDGTLILWIRDILYCLDINYEIDELPVYFRGLEIIHEDNNCTTFGWVIYELYE